MAKDIITSGAIQDIPYTTVPENASLTSDRTKLVRCGKQMQLGLWGRLFKVSTNIATGAQSYVIASFDTKYAPSIDKYFNVPLYSVTNNTYFNGLIQVRPNGEVKVIYCPTVAETWVWATLPWLIGT